VAPANLTSFHWPRSPSLGASTSQAHDCAEDVDEDADLWVGRDDLERLVHLLVVGTARPIIEKSQPDPLA